MKASRTRILGLGLGEVLPALRSPDVRAVATSVLPAALQVLALALWIAALPMIDLDRLTDLGLAEQFPLIAFVALACVAVALAVSLSASVLRWPLLATGIGLLALFLYGTPAIIEDAPRFSTTYIHVGFAEAIGRTGELFPNRDARFDWPNFFILLALIHRTAGINLLEVSPWIPLVANLLYLLPLWAIYRSLSRDPRLAWLGLVVFLAANWIGQDYLSPQGFNFLLYLTVMALVIRWFRSTGPAWPERVVRAGYMPLLRVTGRRVRWRGEEVNPPDQLAMTPASRAGLVLAIAILTSVIVSSHQLSPFVLLFAISALVVVDRCWLRGLPILIGVLVFGWLSYMTVTYLAGHLPVLLGEIGRAADVASESVGGRVLGSEGHRAVVFARLVFSLAIWMLALLGGLRRLAHGKLDLTAGVLAGVPFGALLLQSYGGEILLRIYLFSLPFMVFLAAGLFIPARVRPGPRTTMTLAVVLIALATAFPWVRYGNERAERMTRAELNAVEQVYEIVPERSLVVSGNYNSPFRHKYFERYQYRSVGVYVVFSDIDTILYFLDRTTAPESYLLLTESMRTIAEMFGGMSPGDWNALLADLRSLPELEVVLDEGGVVLFRYEPDQR